jgi:hypothetical protein
VGLGGARKEGLGGAFKCYSVFAKNVLVFAENIFVFARRC